MDATTVAIDLAKDVFELAFADRQGHVVERKRLSRHAFSRCLANRPSLRVVMEACGSAHHWARVFQTQGHVVRLFPTRDVRQYVRGDRADVQARQSPAAERSRSWHRARSRSG